MEQEELEADLLEVGEPSNKLDDPLEDLPAVRTSQYILILGIGVCATVKLSK